LVLVESERDCLSDAKELLTRRLAHAVAQGQIVEERFQTFRDNMQVVLSHVALRRGLRAITLHGGYSLALRRNLSGSPSRKAALTMMTSGGIDAEVLDCHVISTSTPI